MKSRVFGVGIVGFGRIAESAHVPAWLDLPSADVVALADTCPARRAAAKSALPDARIYPSCAEMLQAESLDVLDICTPPSDHATSILAGCASRVGRIVCEKPLTSSQDDYRRIASAQAHSGSRVYTVNSWFQSDLHRMVRTALREGVIGTVTHVSLRTLRPDCALGVPSWQPRWRTNPQYAGGGIVLDHGWHQLYLMANWVGSAPDDVSATLDTVEAKHAPVEDEAVIDIEFPSATGRIELSWAAPSRTNDGKIEGTRGTIHIEDDRLVIESDEGIHAKPYGERLSDSSYHPEWFVALFNQIMNDESSSESRRNLLEAEMLLTTLFQAYEHSTYVASAITPLSAGLSDRAEMEMAPVPAGRS